MHNYVNFENKYIFLLPIQIFLATFVIYLNTQ